MMTTPCSALIMSSRLVVSCTCRAPGSARLETGETTEVMSLDVHRGPRPGDLSGHRPEALGGCPVHVDALDLLVEGVTLKDLLAGHLHVELHGLRVGMDLDSGPLRAVLVDVGVEGEQARLVRLDELDEPSPESLVGLEPALL
jgi:hypothetical protein